VAPLEDHVPMPQRAQALSLEASAEEPANFPASHSVHEREPADENEPRAQRLQDKMSVEPTDPEYFPGLQSVQAEKPMLPFHFPISQSRQRDRLLAPDSALAVPVGQAVQDVAPMLE
jgi:hypothetical protein